MNHEKAYFKACLLKLLDDKWHNMVGNITKNRSTIPCLKSVLKNIMTDGEQVMLKPWLTKLKMDL